MNIYFSEATDDIFDFGDEGTFYVEDHGTDRYFYNGVEHGTNPGGMDEVRIFDGCGRSIPIAVDNIPELVAALQYCYNNVNTINQAKQLESDIGTGTGRVVENYGDFAEVSE